MCRSIRPLFNFEPPASDAEVRAAAEQFVRKIAGFTRPSAANVEAFDEGVGEVASAARRLLGRLVTHAAPKNRDVEAARRRAKAAKRFR